MKIITIKDQTGKERQDEDEDVSHVHTESELFTDARGEGHLSGVGVLPVGEKTNPRAPPADVGLHRVLHSWWAGQREVTDQWGHGDSDSLFL